MMIVIVMLHTQEAAIQEQNNALVRNQGLFRDPVPGINLLDSSGASPERCRHDCSNPARPSPRGNAFCFMTISSPSIVQSEPVSHNNPPYVSILVRGGASSLYCSIKILLQPPGATPITISPMSILHPLWMLQSSGVKFSLTPASAPHQDFPTYATCVSKSGCNRSHRRPCSAIPFEHKRLFGFPVRIRPCSGGASACSTHSNGDLDEYFLW